MRLTIEALAASLLYEQDTGEFYWIAPRKKIVVGARAGSQKRDGYRYIRFMGRTYSEHRLAFFYMTGQWPRAEVDHINMNRADNRWSNLRAASRSENKRNTGIRSDNTSGAKCVSYRADRGVYRAYCNGRHIGNFPTVEEACKAYARTAISVHGPFMRIK